MSPSASQRCSVKFEELHKGLAAPGFSSLRRDRDTTEDAWADIDESVPGYDGEVFMPSHHNYENPVRDPQTLSRVISRDLGLF